MSFGSEYIYRGERYTVPFHSIGGPGVDLKHIYPSTHVSNSSLSVFCVLLNFLKFVHFFFVFCMQAAGSLGQRQKSP